MLNLLLKKTISFVKEHKYSLGLIFVILGVIYPFSLFMYIPKWDSINGYLPYRYFIGDYLWKGKLPLWNPFQRFGYPGYADLQSGCWYPIVWFLLLFGKYTITSLIIEILITFLIAGIGMYKLSNHIHECKKTAFVLGISYALSGFMVGSTQLLVFLIGVAWLPWSILALLKFFKTQNLKYILISAVFVAMQTTGASPSYTIILAYIYVAMFAYFFWTQKNSLLNLKKGIAGGIILVGSLALLLMPYIQSFLEFFPYFNRGEKLDYQDFLIENPFILADYISFLFPYAVISSSDWFELTDLTLRNAYIGLVGLFGCIFILFQPKTKLHIILIACSILSLVIAFGDKTFVYQYIYHLPGFGFFRHPSFFRGYAMFCMLLLAGFSLKRIFSENRFSKIEFYSFWIFLGGLLIVLVYAFSKTSIIELQNHVSHIISLQEISTSSVYSHVIINVFIVALLIWCCYVLKFIFKWSFVTTVIVFTILDFGIQTRLTYPSTMCYKVSYDGVRDYFNKLPNELNQKYNYEPFKNLNDNQGLMVTSGIWKNVATFNKTISSVGENPMRFSSFDAGIENGVLDRNMENSLISFAVKKYQEKDSLQQGYIWDTPTNPIFTQNITTVNSINVDYNSFSAAIENMANHPQWLILNQNYHHLWKAYLNDGELPIQKVNEMVMGVEIPENTSGKIIFKYSSPYLVYSFLISLLSYITISILWFFMSKHYSIR